jgi:predicted nucleotidyltransferase
MQRAEAIQRLKDHEADFKKIGVQTLYLFGSTAREEAGPESDVDLFFEYERGKFGLFDLMTVKEEASRILGCKTDIMTRDSINKYVRPYAEEDAVRVF